LIAYELATIKPIILEHKAGIIGCAIVDNYKTADKLIPDKTEAVGMIKPNCNLACENQSLYFRIVTTCPEKIYTTNRRCKRV
jgi:hypothetical protein